MSADMHDLRDKVQESKQGHAICPNCGARSSIPIIYGYPSEEMLEAGKAGEIRLGGCCITDDDPDWVCSQCGHRWSEPGLTRH